MERTIAGLRRELEETNRQLHIMQQATWDAKGDLEVCRRERDTYNEQAQEWADRCREAERERDAANAKLAVVTLDNVRVRDAARQVRSLGYCTNKECKACRNLDAALAAAPADDLVKRVRDDLWSIRERLVGDGSVSRAVDEIDSLLASLGASGEGVNRG
jgi:chromosome segregation ATPase